MRCLEYNDPPFNVTGNINTSGRTPSDGVYNPRDGIYLCDLHNRGILYVRIIIIIILCVLWLPQVNHTSTVILMADRLYEPVAPLTT